MSTKIQFATVLIVVMGISLVAFLGGFVVFNYYVMPKVTRQGEEIPVPDLRGLTEDEALATLKKMDLRLEVTDEVPDSTYDNGQVAVQHPESGDMVKSNRLIQVVLSLGLERVGELQLSNISQRQATIMLNNKNIYVSGQSRTYSSHFSNDQVINSDPMIVSRIAASGKVDILTSLGEQPQQFFMPNLTGKQESDVRRWLQSFGIIVASPRYKYDAQSVVGHVLEQDPPAGHSIKKGDMVRLVVSGG